MIKNNYVIITRAEAKKQGFKYYFTGKPCKHGHLSNRYVSNNICVECQSISNGTHWGANRDELIEKTRDRRLLHKDEYNQKQKEKYRVDVEYREKKKK